MSRNSDIYGIPAGQVVMAPGSIYQVGPIEGMCAITIKMLAGSTLAICGFGASAAVTGGTVQAGSATFVSGTTFGQGYPLSTSEVFAGNVSGNFYLYCSGTTAVVALAIGRSMGF